MAATQELRGRYRRRAALVTAVPIAAITIAVALFVTGTVVGGTDAPTRDSALTGARTDMPGTPLSSVPDAEATDGVFPVPAGSTTGVAGGTTTRPTVTNDDAYYAELLALGRANRGRAPVVDTSSLYESPIVESSIFELEVEQMLRGERTSTGFFPQAASITDDPELRAMIEEHQALLEYELEMANR